MSESPPNRRPPDWPTDICPPHDRIYETAGGWRCEGCGAVWRGLHEHRHVVSGLDVEPSPELREEMRRRIVDALTAGTVDPDYGGPGWPTCVECGALLHDPQAAEVCGDCLRAER